MTWLRRSAKSLLPLAWHARASYHLWAMRSYLQRVRAHVIRARSLPARPVNADGKVCVHLGCGPIKHPDYINVDGVPLPHVHHVSRIDRLRRFRDGSVDLIYASHCLEHFSHVQTESVLREWHRVLKPGGCLTLSVPDFDALLEIYRSMGGDVKVILAPLFGGQDDPYNFHYTAFTRSSLSEALTAAGFARIRPWVPGTDPRKTMDDWAGRDLEVGARRFPVSLNLEADKA